MFNVGSHVTIYPLATGGWSKIVGRVVAFDDLGPIVSHVNGRTGDTHLSLVPIAQIGRIALHDEAVR